VGGGAGAPPVHQKKVQQHPEDHGARAVADRVYENRLVDA
jgi:hypothetical protein